jgi:hypothetical protein
MEVNPFVCEFDDLANQQQVITTVPGRFLPNVTVLKKTGDGDGMADPNFRFVLPDRRFDKTHADGVDWRATHDCILWFGLGSPDLAKEMNQKTRGQQQRDVR